MTHVFVGYDSREHAAWLVCRDTLMKPFGGDKLNGIHVHPISHRDLRRRGLFSRPWRTDESGQTWDVRDGRPFSTEFAHTRFLVPHLAREMGVKSGPVVFVDCDFMFMRPITDMLHAIDPSKVVSVVKHEQVLSEANKMDGMAQKRYFRKLWSSLMVFNMGHPDIDSFNPIQADHGDGSTLHGLKHLDYREIGEIAAPWNHIPGHSRDLGGLAPYAVHWSLGGPWMADYEHAPYASQWRQRYRDIVLDALDHNLAATFPFV